jgi:hypothetical protein
VRILIGVVIGFIMVALPALGKLNVHHDTSDLKFHLCLATFVLCVAYLACVELGLVVMEAKKLTPRRRMTGEHVEAVYKGEVNGLGVEHLGG